MVWLTGDEGWFTVGENLCPKPLSIDSAIRAITLGSCVSGVPLPEWQKLAVATLGQESKWLNAEARKPVLCWEIERDRDRLADILLSLPPGQHASQCLKLLLLWQLCHERTAQRPLHWEPNNLGWVLVPPLSVLVIFGSSPNSFELPFSLLAEEESR